MSDRDVIQKIALEWDSIERRLHDDSLWGFIYSESNQGLEYESRIENDKWYNNDITLTALNELVKFIRNAIDNPV